MLAVMVLPAQQRYWHFTADGGIQWNVGANASHTDHMEMSGRQVAAIVRYGIDSLGNMVFNRKLVFLLLRTIPNDTRGNLIQVFNENIADSIRVNKELFKEKPQSFSIKGVLESQGVLGRAFSFAGLCFPSTDKAAFIEYYTIQNQNTHAVSIDIPATDRSMVTPVEKGVYGSYNINYKVYNGGEQVINAQGSYSFWVVISARSWQRRPIITRSF